MSDYDNIPVRKDSKLHEYLTMVKETHMLGSYTEALEYLVLMLDPDWDFALTGK